MPPKRSKNNVDVDDEGEGDRDGEEDEVKRIRIFKSNSGKKGDRVMCEMCSSILKSPASLALIVFQPELYNI